MRLVLTLSLQKKKNAEDSGHACGALNLCSAFIIRKSKTRIASMLLRSLRTNLQKPGSSALKW